MFTYDELMDELEAGFITSEFAPDVLVRDAIINEDYNDTVIITVQNFNYDVQIQVYIKDFLTPSEHAEVLKLNNGI